MERRVEDRGPPAGGNQGAPRAAQARRVGSTAARVRRSHLSLTTSSTQTTCPSEPSEHGAFLTRVSCCSSSQLTVFICLPSNEELDSPFQCPPLSLPRWPSWQEPPGSPWCSCRALTVQMQPWYSCHSPAPLLPSSHADTPPALLSLESLLSTEHHTLTTSAPLLPYLMMGFSLWPDSTFPW